MRKPCFMGNGNQLVDPNRRLDAVIGALNAVGGLGDALIDKAFGGVVDAEYKLKKSQDERKTWQ